MERRKSTKGNREIYERYNFCYTFSVKMCVAGHKLNRARANNPRKKPGTQKKLRLRQVLLRSLILELSDSIILLIYVNDVESDYWLCSFFIV